jgi:protoheme IX farnesyltransferase
MTTKFSDYKQLIKLRLSALVVFSAVIGFIYASHSPIDWFKLTMLVVGGFLVTGASNGLNQVIEKDLDKLMNRTSKRPLPDNRMSTNEGLYVSAIMGTVGVTILTVTLNPLSGILGALALASYTFIYTPLKRVTPFAVFVGAIPGAIPAMLGYVAVTGTIDITAFLFFSIQFMWQFPHFWAIAWVLDDDYKKAGFKMLPSPGGRDKSTAYQTLLYTIFLLPISIMPFVFNKINGLSALVIGICGIVFIFQALNLFRTCTIKAASQLMFGSFVYLPIVQMALVLGKI